MNYSNTIEETQIIIWNNCIKIMGKKYYSPNQFLSQIPIISFIRKFGIHLLCIFENMQLSSEYSWNFWYINFIGHILEYIVCIFSKIKLFMINMIVCKASERWTLFLFIPWNIFVVLMVRLTGSWIISEEITINTLMGTSFVFSCRLQTVAERIHKLWQESLE